MWNKVHVFSNLQHPYRALKVRSNRASMCDVQSDAQTPREHWGLLIKDLLFFMWRFAVFGQIWGWLDGNHVSYLFLSGCGLISPPQWTVTMCWPRSVIRQHTLCGSGNTDIKCTSRAAFFHLCNMAKIRNILFQGELEKVVHVFVALRQDYHNSLSLDCPKSSLKSL